MNCARRRRQRPRLALRTAPIPDCASFASCDESLNCADGLDNDLDNTRDCADSDCAAFPACLNELCDGVDNDQDGVVDEDCACSHPSGSGAGVCASARVVAAGGACEALNYEALESTCDGLDNDCDGRIDEGCACDYLGPQRRGLRERLDRRGERDVRRALRLRRGGDVRRRDRQQLPGGRRRGLSV